MLQSRGCHLSDQYLFARLFAKSQEPYPSLGLGGYIQKNCRAVLTLSMGPLTTIETVSLVKQLAFCGWLSLLHCCSRHRRQSRLLQNAVEWERLGFGCRVAGCRHIAQCCQPASLDAVI